MVYHGSGRDDDAIEELRQAIILQPANDDAHRLLGDILARLGRFDEAVAELRRAIDLLVGTSLQRRGYRECAQGAGRQNRDGCRDRLSAESWHGHQDPEVNMIATTLHIIWTLVALMLFVGIVIWAWSGKRKQEFEVMAHLPLEDDQHVK
jgi:cytochrome c oxidase cbb3-type subunit 4